MNVQLNNSPEKKSAILQSALNLIGVNGFHGCPMKMVAQNAGVAAGTIYHYFDSKDTLILELYQFVKSQINTVIFQDDDENLPFQQRFFNLWTSLCNYYISNPSSLTFIEQYISSPYFKQSTDEKTHNRLIVDFFSEGMDKGFIKKLDDSVIAPVFHGTILSAAKLHASQRYNLSDTDLHRVAEIIWEGLKNNDNN